MKQDAPMTPPQQEYIITDAQLKKYEGLFFIDDDAKEDFKTIRSRPHTPEAITEIISQKRGCLTCRAPDCPVWQAADQNCWKSQEDHDAATRADERERVLEKLRRICMKDRTIGYPVFRHIQSLRISTQLPEDAGKDGGQ